MRRSQLLPTHVLVPATALLLPAALAVRASGSSGARPGAAGSAAVSPCRAAASSAASPRPRGPEGERLFHEAGSAEEAAFPPNHVAADKGELSGPGSTPVFLGREVLSSDSIGGNRP